MLTQVRPLQDAANPNKKMQLDPLLAKLSEVFSDLTNEKETSALEIESNPVKHFVNCDQPATAMYQ